MPTSSEPKARRNEHTDNHSTRLWGHTDKIKGGYGQQFPEIIEEIKKQENSESVFKVKANDNWKEG